MNITKDSRSLGFSVGLFIPPAALMLFVLYNIDRFGSFSGVYDFLIHSIVLSKVLSLCVVPNLFAFFAFLRKDAYKSGNGVIRATVLYAAVILIIQFT